MVFYPLEKRINTETDTIQKGDFKRNNPNIKLEHNNTEKYFEFYNGSKEPLAIASYTLKDSEIFIDDFEVYNPSLRGQGIGSSCVNQLIDYFKKNKNIKKITLKASKGEDDSGIYKSAYDFWVGKCGFKDTDEKSIVEYKL